MGCDQDWGWAGVESTEVVAPPPKGKSPAMLTAERKPSPLANIPNGLYPPMPRDGEGGLVGWDWVTYPTGGKLSGASARISSCQVTFDLFLKYYMHEEGGTAHV